MRDFEAFREEILKDRPRLSLDDTFKFACHPGVPCFGKCCANVNIFLTPYDVLRMKRALGMTSSEFLQKYTTPLRLEENQLPVVVLKMGEDEEKRCPFVSDQGCTIYEDRPWSCRMYPLGLASSKTHNNEGEEFCFIVDKEDTLCKGFEEDTDITVEDWLRDQGVDAYNRKSESYMQLTLHPHLQEKKELGEAKIQMFLTASYDLDNFRKMLFESSFFDRFEVPDDIIEKLKTDDEALLDFGINKWLRFALFREGTMIIKDEELERGAKALRFDVD